MADPFFSTATSIVGIIDLLARTTSRLGELKERWRQADFVFVNLIAQLSALKAALNKLQGWIDAEMDDAHHLLVMDLEASITFCQMLVNRIDSEISDLHESAENGLSSQSKLKLIIRNGTLEELQKMVERQTSALTLLLMACNCKVTSEQKILLEKSSSRKIFQRVKDDSSSLYSQRDSASLSSWRTSSSSKISKLFEFDRQLFATKVYDKALPSSLKNTVENLRRPATCRLRNEPSAQDIKRTAIIDQTLEEDSRKRSKECKVLVLGDPAFTQTFMNQIRISHMRGFPDDERAAYKGTVRNNVLDIVEAMACIAEDEFVGLDDAAKVHATLLSRELAKWKTQPRNLTWEVAKAVRGLWQNERLKSKLFDANELYSSKSAPYFVKEILRIAEKDYVPTETDILMARMRASGIQECKFSMGSLGVHVHMFSIGDQRSDRKKFIHQFENVTSIVFSVDLGNYDQVLPGASNQQNLLMESLSVFGSMVNSRWFLRTSIILLLCNAELFRRKLGRTPMNRYFPHYGGGNDVSQASKYIIERFHYLNMNNLSLFPRLCEASDPSNLQIVFTAVQDTIIFNNMKDSGIAVERKNSATSTASSSRKGSNDSAIEDERGLGRGNEVQGTRKERDAHPALRFYSRWDKGKEDKVREEWKEHREDNASRQVAENGDAGEDGNETEPEREVIPSEIGVAL